MANVKPIPEGFRTITPHLVCKGAASAIDFYRRAFGAEEIFRMPGPDGKSIMHAEVKIGDSVLMLCDEFEGMCRSPQTLNGSPVTIHLYVNDVDSAYKRAVDAGAKATMPPMDAFWGDRYGKLVDPFGHEWSMATKKEDVPPAEIGRRAAEAFGGGKCSKS